MLFREFQGLMLHMKTLLARLLKFTLRENRTWIAGLILFSVLLAAYATWLAHYRFTESRLDVLSKEGNSFREEAMGPVWFRRFADKWNLPVPKRIIQFDSKTATDEDLANVAKIHSIRGIFLFGTYVTDAGLSHLERLSNLQFVFLQGMQISDDGLRHLGKLTELRSLWLEGIAISDAGLHHLHGLKSIETLSLVRTGITNNGLARLSRFANLTYLNLERTQVTDKGLAHLKKLKQLKRLDLQGTLVTPSGVARLKAAIPGLIVKTD
jgi:hypothetical protein